MSTDYAENKILSDSYALFDRILYGGIGYGAIVIPLNVFKIMCTLIFPPLGEILSIIGDALLNNFPYITWNTLLLLFDEKNINRIIYSLLLTSMFYIPGLIYTLSKITTTSSNVTGTSQCDPDTGICEDIPAS
jgi:uncharacterized membrane protein YqaE (UPF0057 family)